MDDVFLRVLNPENNAAPLPAVAVLPGERDRMIPPIDRQRNPTPAPDRAERHRRRQQLIDHQRRRDLERADIAMQELELTLFQSLQFNKFKFLVIKCKKKWGFTHQHQRQET